MRIVLLTSDLMVMSRVAGAAQQRGAAMRTASSSAQAVEYCADEGAARLIVDLSTPSLDIGLLMEQLRGSAIDTPTVVAFGPHVQAEWLAAAESAGCDVVVSRGEFFAKLPAMVGP